MSVKLCRLRTQGHTPVSAFAAFCMPSIQPEVHAQCYVCVRVAVGSGGSSSIF